MSGKNFFENQQIDLSEAFRKVGNPHEELIKIIGREYKPQIHHLTYLALLLQKNPHLSDLELRDIFREIRSLKAEELRDKFETENPQEEADPEFFNYYDFDEEFVTEEGIREKSPIPTPAEGVESLPNRKPSIDSWMEEENNNVFYVDPEEEANDIAAAANRLNARRVGALTVLVKPRYERTPRTPHNLATLTSSLEELQEYHFKYLEKLEKEGWDLQDIKLRALQIVTLSEEDLKHFKPDSEQRRKSSTAGGKPPSSIMKKKDDSRSDTHSSARKVSFTFNDIDLVI